MHCEICGKPINKESAIKQTIEMGSNGIVKTIEYNLCSEDCNLKYEILVHKDLLGMGLKETIKHLIEVHCIPIERIEIILNQRCPDCGETFYQAINEVYP